LGKHVSEIKTMGCLSFLTCNEKNQSEQGTEMDGASSKAAKKDVVDFVSQRLQDRVELQIVCASNPPAQEKITRVVILCHGRGE
jgi:hypothetical protein